MLTIRPQQDEVFRQAGLRRFEDDMVPHLNEFAPKHCEVIGEPAVRKVIRLGIEQSKQYGFTNRGPVRFYIELMFMFGSFFDTDVQHPWASEVLNDPAVSDPAFRANGLHLKMTDYLERVSGPENAYARNALREAGRMTPEPIPPAVTDLRLELVHAMEKAYPEKCGWLGRNRVCAVIDGGLAVAGATGVTSPRGMALFAILAFTLGHRFAEDPLYPWISHTISDSLVADPNVRAGKLESRSRAYLNRVLGYLERG